MVRWTGGLIDDRQADRQMDRQVDRQADRQMDRQADRQIDRQADRQAHRQMDRQADRQKSCQHARCPSHPILSRFHNTTCSVRNRDPPGHANYTKKRTNSRYLEITML